MLILFTVAVWYIMWSNIGKIEENRRNVEFLPAASADQTGQTSGTQNDALYIYADCHSSMKGLFFGEIPQHVTSYLTG